MKMNILQAMKMDGKKENILSFNDAITRNICGKSLNTYPLLSFTERRFKNDQDLDWPCKPRKMPLAYNDSTHDLPGFDNICYNANIIDWSCSGRIAASFDCDLILWMPPTMDKFKQKSTILYPLQHMTSLSFDSTGDKLAIGIDEVTKCSLQLWKISDGKLLYQIRSKSICKMKPFDQIVAIAWDSNDKYILG